jgi:hypothetical protein
LRTKGLLGRLSNIALKWYAVYMQYIVDLITQEKDGQKPLQGSSIR